LRSSITKFESESVQLSCHTSSSLPVTWEMRTNVETRRMYSTSTKDLTDVVKIQGRHSVATGGGFYNLTIRELKIADTADYVCIEYMTSSDGFEDTSESTVRLNVEGM